MKKIVLMCIALVLALGSMGVGYSLWSDSLYIEGIIETGEVDWEFYNKFSVPGQPVLKPECTQDDHGIDPGWTKDVGSTTCDFFDTDGDGDYDLMELTILNAYPFYRNHVSTWVHCNGTVPIIIVGAWISFDGAPEVWAPSGDWITNNSNSLRVSFGDNYGSQLHFCDSRDISLTFEVLQPAQQNHQYSFSIRYVAVQYNEYVPGMYVPGP